MADVQHGGRVFEIARRHGEDFRHYLDFSANLNPFIWPEQFEELLRRSAQRICHYPDDRAPDFLAALAGYSGLASEQILPGNGATELLYFLFRSWRPRRVLLPLPTFSEIPRACRVMAVPTHSLQFIRFSPGGQWSMEWDSLLENLKEADFDLLFLVHPNNPTGAAIDVGRGRELLEATRSKGTRVILDESFIDFAPRLSWIELLKEYPQLCILRSLTKFFSIPGLRLGYLAAWPSEIRNLQEIREPWQVNQLAQDFACSLLGRRREQQQVRRRICRARDWLQSHIADIPGFTPCSSQANFLLIHLQDRAGRSVSDLAEQLEGRRILIRCCSGWQGLQQGCFRVAVRGPEDNLRLVQALRDWAAS